jgi:hypothetical protein
MSDLGYSIFPKFFEYRSTNPASQGQERVGKGWAGSPKVAGAFSGEAPNRLWNGGNGVINSRKIVQGAVLVAALRRMRRE